MTKQHPITQRRIWCERSGVVKWSPWPTTFLRGDRDQPFLLPRDLRDWLPEGHLAWFILDVVDQLNLDPFYRAHRADGHGHPAYDPRPCLACCCTATASFSITAPSDLV
jgi:hypothetical protein